MQFAYGIDFGTTNSTVTAVDQRGEIKRISIDNNSFDSSVMRSVVYVNHNHDFSYGETAIKKYVSDVANGKIAKKKLVSTGRMILLSSPASLSGYVPDKLVPEIIEVEEGEGGRLLQSLKSILGSIYLSDISIFSKQFSVEELIGMYLKELKNRADEIVSENVKSVVLGRPVAFVNDKKGIAITRLEKAAKIAGFENIVFEYEPIGAAYDYGISINEKHTVLIFDFGGGTLDITIMKFPERNVLLNKGIPLGGDLLNTDIFNNRIAKHFGKGTTFGQSSLQVPQNIYDNLKNWYSISLLKSQSFYETLEAISYNNSSPETILALKSLINNNLGFSLYQEINRVKTSLSQKELETFLFKARNINSAENISRSDFEKIISHELDKISQLIQDSLDEAKINTDDMDIVATTGGSSLIPIVRNLIATKFGSQKMTSTDAFTSVSTGLALRAHEEFF